MVRQSPVASCQLKTHCLANPVHASTVPDVYFAAILHRRLTTGDWEFELSPVTHFLSGWALANSTRFERRDRALVTWACVIPDIDGLGAIPQLLTRNSAHPLNWFSQYHHMLHNFTFSIVVTIVACTVATRRWKAGLFVFLSFHLHLLEDVVGAKGPDGYWSIPYLFPFSRWSYTWPGQWPLNGWQNFAFTFTLLGFTFWLAWSRGRSPLELFSKRADEAFVKALRARFPRRGEVEVGR